MSKSLIRVLEMSILFFLVFCPLLSLGDRLEGCEDSRCKTDGPIIHFPFRLSHQQKHCGYPGFELRCNSKNDTILELPSSVHLVVEEIDYVSRQVHLFDPNGCIAAKLPSMNLSESYLKYVEDPTVLFNCSEPFTRDYGGYVVPFTRDYDGYLVPCLGSSGYQVHAVSSTTNLDDFLSGPCTKIHQYPYSQSTFGDNKLQLNWPIPLCGNCESKGMDCGFKDRTKLLETHCFNRIMTQKGITKQPLVAGVILGAAFVGIIVFSLYQLYLTSKNERESRVRLERFLEDYKAIRPTRYSYADVKKITEDFNEKLGEGSYGTVYKGRLSSEIYVAVKVLRDSTGKGEEFINEIGTIGTIHHVNVVRLVGFCADGYRRALIYEYLPNDSLERFILPVSSSSDGVSVISWNKLQYIALGTARGIEYLHQGCDQQILHFDIKPQNILLDHNLNPKICDFGLAKLCSKEKSAVTMTAARGTIGYIAPEVLSRNFGKVSHKSDIYSFGMLLLEMVGGRTKMVPKTNNQSKVNSLEWIYRHLENREELKIRLEEEGDGAILRKLAIVALWCIQWHPIDRPSIKEVTQMLEGDGSHLNLSPNPFMATDMPKLNASPHSDELDVILEIE
ncbi:rust resistance kinase Lr10-like isoform X2 [Lycium barbarum]|uniref:rust resistance kinase Lr10-like isoform X2 n=1 Tax=Lycium barbarum TaxID=112863 RepID=UPI00293EC4DA|nr:rust resistance kinase Lr10-like isoform X2 [Lycium barbarum]